MRLYLLRHGEAERATVLGATDNSRRLTASAVATLKHAAHRMALAIGPFDRILSSPLVRAIETADIVSTAFGHFPVPELLVGHAPGLDELIRYLVAPEEPLSITRMQPGTLARVDFELPLRRKAILHWLIPLEAW